MSLRHKLIASFVGLTVLVSLSGIIGLLYVGSINATLNRITDVAAPTVETSDDLIATIWQANSVVEAVLVSKDPHEIAEFETELRRLKRAFDMAYAQLQDLIEDASLLDDLELARNEYQQFVEHSNEAIAQQLLILNMELDCQQRLTRFDATGATLTKMLDEFAAENEAEMQKAEDAGDALSDAATAKEVNDLLGHLFEQDYPVVEASLKLQRLVMELQDTCGDYLAEDTLTKLGPIRQEFERSFAKADGFIETLSSLSETAEDLQDAKDIKTLVGQWDDAVLVKDGLFDSHLEGLKAKMNVERLAALIRSDATTTATALTIVADTADRISDAADELAAKSVSTARWVIALTIAAGVALAQLLGISIMRAITRPFTDLADTVEAVAGSGDLSQRVRVIDTNELGTMAFALNRLLIHLETQAGVADDVAHGILETPIEVLSKVDTLGIALQRMTDALKKNAEEAAMRDWSSTGQSQINDEVRGILEIELLAERVIDSLSRHVRAHRAAFFVCDEANSRLHFAAGYADGEQMTDRSEFGEGEGLLGQVARDRQPILIDQVPPGFFKIESALGQATPVSMLLFPLLYNDCLMGVVEFASFERFADRHIDFLSSVQENICVALRAARSQVELKQLLKQHAIYFRVFKDATDPIVLEDLSGNVVDMNAAAETAYGWEKEDLVGLPIKRIVPKDRHEQADELQRRCVAGGEVSNVEGLRVSRNGQVCDVLITLSLLRDEEDKPIAVANIAKDVTAFKARQAAEEANRAKSDFLANMSHEIRTPMNGIIGMTELALDTELTKEQREYLTTIESSADSLLSLINDILDFSKIEAKKLELDPTDFELRERIGETLITLAMRAHNKGLELAFDVDPTVPERLVGDVHRIRQVLMNLLGNAIKFTEQGEILLSIDLVRQQEQTVTLRFAVTDTGIGLPADKLESIFRPFEQADLSTTRKHGGTGLGLAISVQLVELMGGKLEVQSEVGSGTTFSFTAELGVGSQRSQADAASGTLPLRSLTDMRVLVVDDNETNRRILAEMLKNWGMVPVVVDSGAKGLAALRASLSDQPIGLILSDVNMPEMDGFTFAEKLMSDDTLKNTPIILLTSANRTGDGARCRELGIAAHLIKPARQSLLFDAIATSVGVESVEESPSEQGAAQEQLSPVSGQLRLLLAEDNPTNQKFAVRALTKAGHCVEVANNGQEAVDAWAAEEFDAVLMDIQMPIVDGYLATAEIRQREATSGRHTPIIAMTAHAMKGDQEKCLAAGMDGYVTKPIKSRVMLAEISRVMEEASSHGDTEV